MQRGHAALTSAEQQSMALAMPRNGLLSQEVGRNIEVSLDKSIFHMQKCE